MYVTVCTMIAGIPHASGPVQEKSFKASPAPGGRRTGKAPTPGPVTLCKYRHTWEYGGCPDQVLQPCNRRLFRTTICFQRDICCATIRAALTIRPALRLEQ